MRHVIIHLIIITSCFINHMGLALAAQDMFIQAPVMANLSALGINEVKTDVISPATIQAEINVGYFTEISWRGCTMEYPKAAGPVSNDPIVMLIDRAQFNSFCNRSACDDQLMLRQAWKDAFGIDIWYPYYQAKKVEGWVKKKCSVRIFKLKGEPLVEKGRVMYTFKAAF
jgi:hypothetical protein